MVEFDRLPATSRSLVLTKLTLEMVSKNCKNIFQLARTRNQSVHEVWRDVCRKTGQPLCETPHHVMTPSFYAKAVAFFGTDTGKIFGTFGRCNQRCDTLAGKESVFVGRPRSSRAEEAARRVGHWPGWSGRGGRYPLHSFEHELAGVTADHKARRGRPG